ncbi:unnamed protein product [Brassica oleracea var. botrytis]
MVGEEDGDRVGLRKTCITHQFLRALRLSTPDSTPDSVEGSIFRRRFPTGLPLQIIVAAMEPSPSTVKTTTLSDQAWPSNRVDIFTPLLLVNLDRNASPHRTHVDLPTFCSPIRNTPPSSWAMRQDPLTYLQASPRPLERNLLECDFQQLPLILTTEEVMNDLHEKVMPDAKECYKEMRLDKCRREQPELLPRPQLLVTHFNSNSSTPQRRNPSLLQQKNQQSQFKRGKGAALQKGQSKVSRIGLIGESSQTYVSRTGFRRRSGAICGGGIEIQASHPIDFALLPVEGEAEGGRGGTRRKKLRRDIV